MKKVIEQIEKRPARSAWSKGIVVYADMITQDFSEKELIDSFRSGKLEETLLNGARNWKEYSYGGLALITDEIIAETLCAPYELKATDNGRKRPNRCEIWLDVQARALFQACALIKDTMREIYTESNN